VSDALRIKTLLTSRAGLFIWLCPSDDCYLYVTFGKAENPR
jgi:hypothetical protein